MKVGVLTQRLHCNYGGLLQNYALQQVLKRAGHEVYTLDWAVGRRNPMWYVRVIGLFIAHFLMPARFEKPDIYRLNKNEDNAINANIYDFINRYISRTKIVKRNIDFKIISENEGFDAFIVGSDQCWRPRFNRFQYQMYLKFARKRQDITRIAYAASFGTSNWEYTPKMTLRCQALAALFDVITVREDTGVDLCRTYLGVEATHVLDPTMLLTKQDYMDLIEENNESVSSGNLYYYFLDPSDIKIKAINQIEKESGYKAFSVIPRFNSDHRTKANIKHNLEQCIYPRVTMWLRAFLDAELVIVDSFHGMVFSIIFNKPFWVIGNQYRGMARFESLLKIFHLENRLINIEDLSSINILTPINWVDVNNVLDQWRQKSKNLLLLHLK